MFRACLKAVTYASRNRASLFISRDPRATFLCAVFCRILRLHLNHYVDSFNFPELPTGIKRRLMRYAFQPIKAFDVHSSMERSLYSEYFSIPLDRLRLRLWTIGVPEVSPAYPLHEGKYVSAIGVNGRDYKTLLEACLKVPHIRFVLVVRRGSLTGLTVPANVTVVVNVPLEHAMNILAYSAFTVLPLSGNSVPCGHVTLVCAMHLAKAVVATHSEGIADYLRPGYNGVTCEAQSAESLATKISELWEDPEEADRLGANSKRFGEENCSEARMEADMIAALSNWNIPLKEEMIPAEACG
jgi:glycosyltransferase involved in cell wall biosynthesis